MQSTVGSAGMTRERAQEVVDDVVRRAEQGAARAGRGVREARHRQAEAAAGVGDRLRDAIPDLRMATREDIKKLAAQVERLANRVAALDREVKQLRPARKPARRTSAAKPRTTSRSTKKAKPRGRS